MRIPKYFKITAFILLSSLVALAILLAPQSINKLVCPAPKVNFVTRNKSQKDTSGADRFYMYIGGSYGCYSKIAYSGSISCDSNICSVMQLENISLTREIIPYKKVARLQIMILASKINDHQGDLGREQTTGDFDGTIKITIADNYEYSSFSRRIIIGRTDSPILDSALVEFSKLISGAESVGIIQSRITQSLRDEDIMSIMQNANQNQHLPLEQTLPP